MCNSCGFPKLECNLRGAPVSRFNVRSAFAAMDRHERLVGRRQHDSMLSNRSNPLTD